MYSNIYGVKESKTQSEYFDDYPVYLLSSLKTCKEAVFNNNFDISDITGRIQKKPIKDHKIEKKILSTNWDEINNLVLGIRDNEYLLNTLNTCKRGKMGLGYIFIESIQYISVIIKKPNCYPFVIIRIPVEQPFVYINQNAIGSYFEFPIDMLVMKENTSKSKNKQYKLYLYKDETFVLRFEVLYNNDIKSRTITDIKQKDPIVINELMKPTMHEYLNRFRLDTVKDITYSINNMNLIVLKKLASNQVPIMFEVPQNKMVAFLEFYENSLKFVISSFEKKDEQEILNKDNTEYWPQISYTNKKYVLHSYDTMFKISHYSMPSSKESIYYLFTSFQNSYMFIKLITDQNIFINNDNKIYTYQELFNKGSQVLEMYLLIEDDEI